MSVTQTSGGAGTPQLVPSWLANLASVSWRLVVVGLLGIVVLWIIGIFWICVASTALAILISAVFAPTMRSLRERGYSNNKAALSVFGLALLAIALIVTVFVLALLPFVAELVRFLATAASDAQAWLAQQNLPDPVSALLKTGLEAIVSAASGPIGAAVASIAGAATIVLLAIFLVFFFVRDAEKAWLWFFQNTSVEKTEDATAAGREALDRVASYMRNTTVLAIIGAVTTWVFLLILGVPVALPLALVVFIAAFVPFFGTIIATVAVVAVALVANGGVTALILLALMVARVVIVNYMLRPRIVKRRDTLHPALVLVAMTVGYQLAGLVGVIVAVPTTMAILSGSRAILEILEPNTAPHLPSLVPGWLDVLAQYSARLLIVIALLALAVGLFVSFPLVIIPVVVALILAATLDSIVAGLIARGWSRTMAAAVSIGGGIFGIAAILILAVVALPSNVTGLASAAVGGASGVDSGLNGNAGITIGGAQEVSLALIQSVATLTTALVAIILIAAISALLGFFFLRDGGRLWTAATDRLKPEAVSEVRYAGRRAFDALGGYMLGTAAVSFVGAASQWAVMVLLGLPYALPIFVLSFLLCFIPYFGGYITTGLAFLITVQFGTPLEIAFMFAWTMVFNIVQGNVLAPIVYGRTVHIHPAIVLLSVPAGAAVAGVAGMFLAVPVAGVIAGTWRSVLKVLGDRIASGESAVSSPVVADPVPPPAPASGTSEALAPG